MRIKKDEIHVIMAIKNQTQTDIGRKLGVSHQLISAWINGHRNPKLSNVQKLASALDCSITDIAEVENSIEELALKGDKFAKVLAEQSEDFDYVKDRIDKIYAQLDRASRAELLAAAERIAEKK